MFSAVGLKGKISFKFWWSNKGFHRSLDMAEIDHHAIGV